MHPLVHDVEKQLSPPDAISFAKVYADHCDFLWSSARALGVRGDDIGDVMQDVFVVVHRQLAAFEARSSLRTWLYAILVRVVADHRRRMRRKPSQSLDDQWDAPDDDIDLEGVVAAKEQWTDVEESLARMPGALRTLFVSLYIDEFSPKEAAEILELPIASVYAQARQARDLFERELARVQTRKTTDAKLRILKGASS